MTNKGLFIKAHKVARMINFKVGCYQIAFSMALKATYNNFKLPETIAIQILAGFEGHELQAAEIITQTLQRADGVDYYEAVSMAVDRVHTGIKFGINMLDLQSCDFKDGKFESMFISGVPTWILRQKYVDMRNLKLIKRTDETEKAVKFHVSYDLRKIYSKDTMVNHEEYFFDTILGNTHTDIWVPKSVMRFVPSL